MLHHYKNGIAHPAGCPKQPNHAVLLVGYGIEGGQPFWTLKNSWGVSFGLQTSRTPIIFLCRIKMFFRLGLARMVSSEYTEETMFVA